MLMMGYSILQYIRPSLVVGCFPVQKKWANNGTDIEKILPMLNRNTCGHTFHLPQHISLSTKYVSAGSATKNNETRV